MRFIWFLFQTFRPEITTTAEYDGSINIVVESNETTSVTVEDLAMETISNISPFNFTNSTRPTVLIRRTSAELAVGLFTFFVIMVMTVVGNILVILSIMTYKPLNKVQNYFLVSLSAADLCVATLVMPFHVVKFILGEWIFGLVLCQMWLTFDILSCTASILNLCAIALDRYWAITNPITYCNKRTPKLVLSMIAAVWTLSSLISVPPLIGWNDWSEEHLAYTCELTQEKAFVVYSASGSFYIPLIVMTTVYVKIFLAARHRLRSKRVNHVRQFDSKTSVVVTNNSQPKKSTVNHSTETTPMLRRDTKTSTTDQKSTGSQEDENETNPPTADVTNNASNGHQIKLPPELKPLEMLNVQKIYKERERISVSKEKKAAKTLAIIMGVFVLCWLPFFLMYILKPFCDCGLHPKIEEVITWLGYINSALNPVIYTIFNMDFRRAFHKYLCFWIPVHRR